MSKGTVHARIRLKNDTEKNWNKSNFIPLQGELIIYSTDEAHPFFRLKVGDGVTVVTELPFIDAGTINGIDINNFAPSRLSHSITFGANQAYTFDGSTDVIVPVYMGNLI